MSDSESGALPEPTTAPPPPRRALAGSTVPDGPVATEATAGPAIAGEPAPPAVPPPAAPPPPGWMPPPLPTTFDVPAGPVAEPPAGFGYSPPPGPTRPWGAPPITGFPRSAAPGVPQPWDAPAPGPPVPPASRRPRRWVPVVVGIVVVGLVVAVALLWTRGVFTPTPSASPSGTSVPSAPVQVSGGDVGRSVELRATTGTAQVTATRAEWSSEGELAPEPGMAYLVLEVELAGVSGEVPVGAVMTAVETADQERYPLAFGPTMPEPVPGTLLHAGDTVQGSLGYQVPPGAVSVHFLGEDGEIIGTVEVPGP